MFTNDELILLSKSLGTEHRELSVKISRILKSNTTSSVPTIPTTPPTLLSDSESLHVDLKCNFTQTQYDLYTRIRDAIKDNITLTMMTNARTHEGLTQVSERKIIDYVKKILDNMGLSYIEAGRQQPVDFRFVGGILDVEIKKCDSKRIAFNDTKPKSGVLYVAFWNCKHTTPQVTFFEGSAFSQDSLWIDDYEREIQHIKDVYVPMCKKMGRVTCYTRPNYFGTMNGIENDDRFETFCLKN